jgi:hypothetical protein
MADMSDDIVLRLRSDGSSWAQPMFNEAADEIERLREAITVVVETFARDEEQGYRSRDRRFAIDVLRMVLSPESSPWNDPHTVL